MPILDPNATVEVSTTLNNSEKLNNINLLQPNAFKLTIDRRNFANLEFFAQMVLHPDVSATPAELPYQRVGGIPFAGDKLTFGEFTAMIILDENLNSYTEMYNWITRIVQQNDVSALNRTDNIPPTNCDITVSILSSHNNTTRKIKYLDAVPTGLGNINLESTSAGDYITYPATFRYSYFEIS
jgi:hypothetical protein